MNGLYRLWFYLRYAFRSFRRGGARAVFAVFCVAAGVAAVVALQLVSANLKAAITGNAQQQTRGDVAITAPPQGMTLKDYRYIQSLARQHAFVTYTPLVESLMTIRPVGGDPNAVELGVVQAVDPSKYPFYDRIVEKGTAGQTLAQALEDRTHILVNQAIYDKLHLRLGMHVQVNIRAHRLDYVVWGIAPNTAAQFIGNPYALSTFVIANVSDIQPIMIAEGNAATRVYIKTRDASQAAAVKRSVETRLGPLYTVNTAADVEKQNEDAAKGLNQFMNIMGLLAVVIGGVGIVNAMLVAVRRRRKEIAVVKSLGMKQGQVIGTFSLGAIALGITGGLVGIVLGIGASFLVQRVTQDIMATTALEWKIRAGPLIAGMLVAIAGTVLFAFFPVEKESQVRPIAALRDEVSEPVLSRRGRWLARLRTGGLIVALAIAGGILAGYFLDLADPLTTVVYGAMIGIGTLLGLGLLTLLFSWVVALVSKLPAFHSLTLRLSFRSLGRQRSRMASILLALCVGILSVGTVTIMASDLKSSIASAANRDNSFNAVVFYGLGRSDMAKVHAAVDKLPGVISKEYAGVNAQAQLIAVDGMNAALLEEIALQSKSKTDQYKAATAYMRGLEGRDLVASGELTTRLKEGRPLGPQDAGTNHVMVNGLLAQALGIRIGSILNYRMEGHLETFQVVAIADPNAMVIGLGGVTVDNSYLQRIGGLTSADRENYSTTYLKIESGAIAEDVTALNKALPRATVLDLTAVVSLINDWIDKFAMFPQVLAGLSLFAGAVIIANAVALTMMERRREIAIMKAVGAKRRFVLQELLTENAVIGLVGALTGTGLAMVATAAIDQAMLGIAATFNPVVVLGLLALGTGLAVAAALITAWPASGEKPFSVLRYE